MNRFSKIMVAFLSFYLCNISGFAQKSLNLDFEIGDHGGMPFNWFGGGTGYKISLDNSEKHLGQSSLKIEMTDVWNEKSFGHISTTLPIETFAGKNIEFKGWIKTKEVKNGYVGLWFMVMGENNKMLGYDNMNDRVLKATY